MGEEYAFLWNDQHLFAVRLKKSKDISIRKFIKQKNKCFYVLDNHLKNTYIEDVRVGSSQIEDQDD